MTRLYDLFVLLDPHAPGERQQEILANIRSSIESGGTLVGAHEWGQRRIAFEIDHRAEADYHIIQFESESNDLLERLDHALKITDGVLRFRIIRLKPGSGPPPQPRPDGPRYREEGRDGPPRDAEPSAAPPAADAAAPPVAPEAAPAPEDPPAPAEVIADTPAAPAPEPAGPEGGEDTPSEGVPDPAPAA